MFMTLWIIWAVIMVALAIFFYLRGEVGIAKGFIMFALGPLLLLALLAGLMLGSMVYVFPTEDNPEIRGRIK